MDDEACVEAQIGRPVRSRVEVAARCHLGLPTVIRVPPELDDGTPFPTRYWLTCPVAQKRVSGLEATGMVRSFQRRRNTDPDFAAACDAADREYRADRGRGSGGVAGTHGGVKCLHAHLAHHMAGGTNPIGDEVAALTGPPACTANCV